MYAEQPVSHPYSVIYIATPGPDFGTLRELPHCDAALPGEICEADGECGTSRTCG